MPGWKFVFTKSRVAGKYCAIVGGNARIAAAKMIGMTPAMFTRSGRYVEPPAVIFRPTIRLAYCTGMRRWPSWTKTTAAQMPTAISGKNSFSIGPPFHQATIPSGAATRIDAKIRIEMPLPMPRFVISSPIHMSSTVPAVRETMMSTISPEPAFSAPWLRKRKA